ncbi:hypothetical protein [Lactococcus cremoris]|uniref:hypothetical protein n=1 Tax=Lactococcus lactis subsp. cremoris TaxID=1359 RepID=UPI002181F462|nr:hypothetical protein [Lactococcus cremoris]
MSYEKQTWNKYDDLKTEEENIVNGAVVTDNRMNHIEEGIYSHTIDISNPHKVTAAQVGLGNIQNFGLATEDEAKQGDSNAKYMTPSLTQAVLSANINSIAYANSADGTDGFTTIYPNLNLFEGSRKYTKDNPKTVSSNAIDGWVWLEDVHIKNLKAGTYTLSAKSDAPWVAHWWIQPDKEGKVGLWLISTQTGEWINLDKVPQTIEVHKDGDYFIRVNTYSNGTDIETHSFWNFKLEPGSTATPYMPSATEVTTADWPKYVGFSNTVKTNKSASDYTWFPVKDSELTNKVESHINNKANPHAVTASQVGAYSKSESDSKLTALENKSISNKGNLKKGDDLNDITATGFYRIGGFVGGTEILNVPTELSGVKFYAFVTVTEAIQELTVYAPINSTTWTYSRSISGTKPTWSSWSKTVMADDSGKVKLTDFEVTTISETVNIGNGLSLNFQRKGEFVLVRFSGSLTAINSGTYFSTAVPEQWRPDGIKELIGHFASGALAFHVDLETDGRVKWWGASGATGAPRGTAMYFLK